MRLVVNKKKIFLNLISKMDATERKDQQFSLVYLTAEFDSQNLTAIFTKNLYFYFQNKS